VPRFRYALDARWGGLQRVKGTSGRKKVAKALMTVHVKEKILEGKAFICNVLETGGQVLTEKRETAQRAI